jgi:hypothetical protein
VSYFHVSILPNVPGTTYGEMAEMRVAAGWYALTALAATLALVPRERVCWIVKRGPLYVHHNDDGSTRLVEGQRSAERFRTREEALCNCFMGERVVRLRTRRST